MREFPNFTSFVDDYARHLRTFRTDAASKVSPDDLASFGWMVVMVGLELLDADHVDALRVRLEGRRLL